MYIFLLILVSSKVLLSVTEIDNFCESHYKLAWTESRKSYCTTPGVGVGIGDGSCVGVTKMLKFLHLSFLCDGQGAVRRATCPCDRSCFSFFSPAFSCTLTRFSFCI